MGAMYKKEMRAYFSSMMGYIFLVFFTLITGVIYSLNCVLSMSGDFISVLSTITIMFLLLIPIITMRLIAEETKQKTDQLLYTSPIKVSDVVIGKYFAALSLLSIGMVIIALFPIMLSAFGSVSFAETLGAFVAFFLVGACTISVGLFVSSLTENQIIAAVASFGALLVLFFMDSIVQLLPGTRVASVVFAIILIALLALFLYNNIKNLYISGALFVFALAIIIVLYVLVPTIFDGLLVNVFGWFSIMKRFNNFYYGIFDLSSIVYYISFSAVFVYLTIQVIEKKRWS